MNRIFNQLKSIPQRYLLIIIPTFLIVGFAIGCLFLGKSGFLIYQIGLVFINNFINATLQFITNLKPEREFLIQILTFEGVILAIAIPLSIDMISRMSDKLESDALTNRFRREWPVKWLIGILISTIVMKIFILFFLPDVDNTIFWKPIAWIVLLLFVCVIWILFKYIKLLLKYLSVDSSEYIIKGSLDEARKILRR
jgi:hypothetical protein